MNGLKDKNILLIVTGSIAAYKALDLVRSLRDEGAVVRCVMTKGAEEFITPLSLASLSQNKVYTDLFSLTDEAEMGHIRLARQADLVVVAPASADFIARMALGLANDLASTLILATDRPIMVVPAMNVVMWQQPIVQIHVQNLQQRGVQFIGPAEGDLACGEFGAGRMIDIDTLVDQLKKKVDSNLPLKGLKALVTSGPTYEPIDPVRFIGNRSSGKQGIAIAESLAQAGADVMLVTGPTALSMPACVNVVRVQTAQEMFNACHKALPVDIVVCAAAVADWALAKPAAQKIKKETWQDLTWDWQQNPDILASLAGLPQAKRPKLVIGFAAESDPDLNKAQQKHLAKKCDWLIVNDIKDGAVFGSDDNQVTLLKGDKVENWPLTSKKAVADRLIETIISKVEKKSQKQ